MHARLTTLIAHDARLQYRSGIHAAYAVVVACYVVVFWFIGARLPNWLKVVIVYTDPSVLGFFFLGGLMLLERAEGTRAAMAMTPIEPAQYLWAKAVSLTGVSLIAACTIVPFAHVGSFSGARALLLVFTVCATSVHYVGLGALAALRAATTTGYLLGAALWLTPIVLPGVLAFSDPLTSIALLLPAAAHVALLRHALGDVVLSASQVAVASAVAFAAALSSMWAGTHQLRRSLGSYEQQPSRRRHTLAPRRRGRERSRRRSGLARFLSVVTYDLRNLGRDPTLVLVGLASLLPAIAFAAWNEKWDRLAHVMFGVNNFSASLTPVVLVMPAVLLGWVLGFLYIEDRDDGPLQVLEISPLGKERYFAYRAVWFGGAAWGVALLSVRLVAPHTPLPTSAFIATLVAAEALLAALVLAALARNKIEGLAITKLMNLAVLVPLFAVTASPWRLVASVVPTYWIGELCNPSGVRQFSIATSVVLSGAVHGIAGWLLYRARR